MSNAKPLSDSARRALEAAAARSELSVLPLPADVPVRGVVRQRLLAGLLSSGLLEEAPATDASSTWRTEETGRGVALRLTGQGLAAIGRTPRVTQAVGRRRRTSAATDGAAQSRLSPPPATAGAVAVGSADGPEPAHDGAAKKEPGGKLGGVLAALATDAGATLSELVALTGWQPHTTRAALTRLRQRGYALERTERDGAMAYRITSSR